jgi:SAM-dependent methyltransferase
MHSRYSYHYLSKIYDATKSTFWKEYRKILKPYIKPQCKVLDLGCGTGLAIEYLNISNQNYLGVDLSTDMLEIAQKKFPTHNFRIDSITNLNLNISFDVVIMAFDTLNHLLSKEDWMKAFKVANIHLSPSSYFIFDVVTPFDHKDVWPNHSDITESESWLYIQRGDYNTKSGIASLKTTIFHKEKEFWSRHDETIQQISFSIDVIKEMLQHVGLHCQVCLDTNTRNDPHVNSNSIVFICQKIS